MFKKSQHKIVAVIMTILVLLWVSTLCIIYISSYYEVLNRNREMLNWYIELYMLEAQPINNPPIPDNRPRPDIGNPRFENTPAFHLSTFYSVAISKDGKTLAINNTQTSVHENKELEEMAYTIIKKGKIKGITNNLVYHTADKGGYLLVAFMDNTIIQESMTTLFRYTVIIGGAAVIALFFLAKYLAKKIVQPLEESYQKQKQFISDAGHELKTPVSIVSANAELLSLQIGENQWLANIQYENERMGTLISQLLELARTENVIPERKPLNFSRLVRGEALPFESIIFEKGLSVEYKITDNLYVNGNSTQLKQLIAILIDNAVRHCNKESKILLTLSNERNLVILSVINDGEEIPVMQRKQIFERFYRIDSARNSEDNHYGLGLPIAKAIVTAHNGKIEVSCYNGKIEFTVRIPAQK